jgi:hypothetical protein
LEHSTPVLGKTVGRYRIVQKSITQAPLDPAQMVTLLARRRKRG